MQVLAQRHKWKYFHHLYRVQEMKGELSVALSTSLVGLIFCAFSRTQKSHVPIPLIFIVADESSQHGESWESNCQNPLAKIQPLKKSVFPPERIFYTVHDCSVQGVLLNTSSKDFPVSPSHEVVALPPARLLHSDHYISLRFKAEKLLCKQQVSCKIE